MRWLALLLALTLPARADWEVKRSPFDATLVARYKQLDLPTYSAGINPELSAELDANGKATAVRIAYPRDPVRQYLAYGNMYRQR